MNRNEIELKVQALVDGELTGSEAEALRQRINDDAGLQQLHVSLTQMRGLIADSELPRPLPESGDFYWNKIAETIEREESAGERAAPPTPRVGRARSARDRDRPSGWRLPATTPPSPSRSSL